MPFKLNLAKRLAQCLNPALPAGVHQKTLEIYEIIFRKIGVSQCKNSFIANCLIATLFVFVQNAGLAKDLSVYSFGLFPFFEHSATLVKSSLLELYELYLIPLGVELRPSLRPLVLSIIPGLEEESSEHFGKVYQLLNMIKVAAGSAEFYEALWTSLLISPRHRLAIVNYLSKSIPQGVSSAELDEICVANRKLVARAIASALGDRIQLVVRGSLDILLKHFPVSLGFFDKKELTDLYAASMLVLMRKDMSLTRRFYSWILNIDPITEQESLSESSLAILIESTRNLINDSDGSLDSLSLPFKLLVFVLDKPIVADPLIKACMFDLILLLLRNSGEINEKLIPVANTLFRMLELDVIWGQLAGQLSKITPPDPDGTHLVIQAVSFSIMHLSVCDESSLMVHIHLTIYVLLKRLFTDFSEFPKSIASEILELCLLFLAKVPVYTETISIPECELHGVESLCTALIEGNCSQQSNLTIETVAQIIVSNVELITEHSLLFVMHNAESNTEHQIEIISKASTILTLLLQRLRPNSQHLALLKYARWIEVLCAGIKETENESIMMAILMQLSEHSTYSMGIGELSAIIKEALIECLLPKLWKWIVYDGRELATIAPLIARVAHFFPQEVDIFFAEIISNAMRHGQSDILECFALLWNYSMNSNLLLSVPLRLSVTVMTEALCASDSPLKSRKCSFTWSFVLCQHLSALLEPILAVLADVIECGFNSNIPRDGIREQKLSSLQQSFPQHIPVAFKQSFDADEVTYYLELLKSLLETNFDGAMNYIQGKEVSPALLSQWLAFEDSLRLVLQVELGTVERRSYYDLVLVLMVPLLLLDDGDCGVKGRALELIALLGRAAGRDSAVIFNVLIALSIDNLSTAVSRDVEKQTVIVGFFLELFRGNDFITGLFDREDIVSLGELCRKALRSAVDIEVVQAWTDFFLAIAFLPRSDVELIPTVLLDSVYLRLTAIDGGHFVNEALLTSILSSVAKLTIFYFASHALPNSSTLTLKKSVSGLLSDTIQDIIAASPIDIRSGPAALNFGAIESILFAFLEVHTWLKRKHCEEGVGSRWSQCMIMLSDTCRQFYLMSPSTFTHLLVTLFMKHQQDHSEKVSNNGSPKYPDVIVNFLFRRSIISCHSFPCSLLATVLTF